VASSEVLTMLLPSTGRRIATGGSACAASLAGRSGRRSSSVCASLRRISSRRTRCSASRPRLSQSVPLHMSGSLTTLSISISTARSVSGPGSAESGCASTSLSPTGTSSCSAIMSVGEPSAAVPR
jgi:hypothetical protein